MGVFASPRLAIEFIQKFFQSMLQTGAPWFAHQRHLAVFGCPVAFSGIAGNASADGIFPGVSPTLGLRYDVIDGGGFFVELFVAVLAVVFIAAKNIVAGVSDGAGGGSKGLDVPFEFDDLRQGVSLLSRTDETVVRFDKFRLLCQQQNHSFLPADHSYRFITGIQDKRLHCFTSRAHTEQYQAIMMLLNPGFWP